MTIKPFLFSFMAIKHDKFSYYLCELLKRKKGLLGVKYDLFSSDSSSS